MIEVATVDGADLELDVRLVVVVHAQQTLLMRVDHALVQDHEHEPTTIPMRVGPLDGGDATDEGQLRHFGATSPAHHSVDRDELLQRREDLVLVSHDHSFFLCDGVQYVIINH